MTIKFVEDNSLQGKGVDEVRRRFNILRSQMSRYYDGQDSQGMPWEVDRPIPYGLHQDVCLLIDEDSLDSVINAEKPQDPNIEYDDLEPQMPFPFGLKCLAGLNEEGDYAQQFRMLYQKKHKTGYLIAVDCDYPEEDVDYGPWYPAEIDIPEELGITYPGWVKLEADYVFDPVAGYMCADANWLLIDMFSYAGSWLRDGLLIGP